MDYEALAHQLPLPVQHWKTQHVTQWLQFVHLSRLVPAFNSNCIQGPVLASLTELDLERLGVTSSIIKRKLVRWIQEGFPEFEKHLLSSFDNNKENLPPIQRQPTTENGSQKLKPSQPWRHNQSEEGMVIRSCDGSLAAYYVMKEKKLKIGRSSSNTVRSLEVSVEEEHAEVSKLERQYFLLDKGTQAGTFIKLTFPRILRMGTLIEMGSFLIEVKSISKQQKSICLEIAHMLSDGKCDLNIELVDSCHFYSFGRRKTNNFYADDQHLSGIHAKIFMQRDEFVIEDMHSTNGTWLRLSKPQQPSEPFELEEGSVFKVGTTITYQCIASEVKAEKMDIEYEDSCLSCNSQKRNMLFLPCKHNVVCSGCAEAMTDCPLCTLNIGERIKIYT